MTDPSRQPSGGTATETHSQIKQRTHKATTSQSTVTPPRRRRTTSSRSGRAVSIISTHTDLELCAFADLLSPSVGDMPTFLEDEDFGGAALDDLCDDYLDADINSIVRATAKTATRTHLLLEHEEPLSPPFDAHFPSPSSESEQEPSSDSSWSFPSTYSPTYFSLPRRGRLRARANTGVSTLTSDSDTPSLSSSTSFSSRSSATYSQPHSPATLKTPIDHVPCHPTIIEERSPVERSPRRLSQSSGSIIFAPIDVSSDVEKSTARMPKAIEPRSTKTRNVEHLRLNVPPIPTHFPPLSSPLPSLGKDLDPQPLPNRSTPTPSTRTVKLSLNRITSRSRQSSQSQGSSQSHESPPSISPTTSVVTKRDLKKEEAKEAKSRRAEAKRMKKAEEKARTERLAEELKERQRRKMLAQDSRSIRSHGARGRRWDEERSMYDGLGAF